MNKKTECYTRNGLWYTLEVVNETTQGGASNVTFDLGVELSASGTETSGAGLTVAEMTRSPLYCWRQQIPCPKSENLVQWY